MSKRGFGWVTALQWVHPLLLHWTLSSECKKHTNQALPNEQFSTEQKAREELPQWAAESASYTWMLGWPGYSARNWKPALSSNSRTLFHRGKILQFVSVGASVPTSGRISSHQHKGRTCRDRLSHLWWDPLGQLRRADKLLSTWNSSKKLSEMPEPVPAVLCLGTVTSGSQSEP